MSTSTGHLRTVGLLSALSVKLKAKFEMQVLKTSKQNVGYPILLESYVITLVNMTDKPLHVDPQQ